MSTLNVTNIKAADGTSGLTIANSTGIVTKSLMPYIYLRGNSASEVIQHGSAADYTNWSTETVQGGMAFNSSNGRITVPLLSLIHI